MRATFTDSRDRSDEQLRQAVAAREPSREYVYLREAFGETAGFLSGWTSFIAGFSGAIAAAAVTFAAHTIGVVPGLETFPAWTGAAGPVTVTISRTTIIAVAIIVVFTVVSLLGIGAGRFATNGPAFLIVAGLAALALSGSFTGARATESAGASSGGISALSALVPIFFTYSGWNAAAYVAGEWRSGECSGRTAPPIWQTRHVFSAGLSDTSSRLHSGRDTRCYRELATRPIRRLSE